MLDSYKDMVKGHFPFPLFKLFDSIIGQSDNAALLMHSDEHTDV